MSPQFFRAIVYLLLLLLPLRGWAAGDLMDCQPGTSIESGAISGGPASQPIRAEITSGAADGHRLIPGTAKSGKANVNLCSVCLSCTFCTPMPVHASLDAPSPIGYPARFLAIDRIYSSTAPDVPHPPPQRPRV